MPDNLRIDEIIDRHGAIRRLGTQINPAGITTALPPFTSVGEVYDDAAIKKLCADPDRVPSEVRFDKTWILNQGHFGSCEGHAEAAVLARARVRRGLKKILFSGPFAYSKVNNGRDNGAALEDGLKAIQKWGICPIDIVPNADQIYPSLQPKNADEEAAKYKGSPAWAIPDIQTLKSALAAGLDCVVAVHVGSRFDTLSKVNRVCGVDNGVGNHAVCLDGIEFVNGMFRFKLANSWGLSFGDDGRGNLISEHFQQTITHHTFYALASTEEASE